MALDPETEERIEQPVSAEAERETRLSPREAVAQMRLNVPVRGNRKLRRILERVNAPLLGIVLTRAKVDPEVAGEYDYGREAAKRRKKK